jgi:ABC-2 type transport system permease protein
MRRFRALIKKEMIHMLRDPRTLVFIFLMPILQLVLLGYANNTEIRNVPTVVFNQDNSKASRALLDSFDATGYFSFDHAVYSQAEVNQLIDSGKVKVGIVIPPDYSHNLSTRQTADVLVLLDGADPTIAGAVLSAAALVGQAHGTNVRSQQTVLQGGQGGGSIPVDIRTRVFYNPDLLGSYNIVPGLIAMILFQTGTSLTALAIVKERERGTMEQLIVTPIRSWELILAKIIPYILVSFANTILIMAIGSFLFGVPLRGSILLLFALVGVYLLPILGLGLLISTAAQTQ